MKKVFVLIITLFMVSGCTINYDLTIKDGKITENLKFNVTNKEYSDYAKRITEEEVEKDSYKFFKTFEIPIFNHTPNKFLNKKLTKNSDSLDVNYSYDKFSYENFNTSYMINNCFDEYVVLNDEDYYYISANGEFICYYDTTTISLKTDKKMLHTTAKYKDCVYVYEINKDNYKDVNIIFQIDKDEPFIEAEVIEEELKKENNGIDIGNIIWIIILGAAFVGLVVLSKKYK